MGFQLAGNSGTLVEVESATKATRLVLRPIDWGSLGSYAVGASSGTMAAGLGAAANIFAFRYTSTNLAVVRRILFTASNAGTGFTAGVCTFNLFVARAFTVSATGGTALTLTTNNMKLRTSMGTTAVGDIRLSSTATLSAGTWTLDANPVGQIVSSVPVTASIQMVAPQTPLLDERVGEFPLVLAQNEGFTIQATVPATGTWSFAVNAVWEELTSF